MVNPICLQECRYTKKSQLVVRKGRGADGELGRASSRVGKELDKREPRKNYSCTMVTMSPLRQKAS